jgi:anti-repressor protein
MLGFWKRLTEPWFVAADICAILEIGNARDAVRSLPQKGVSTADILTEGGIQRVKIVNEANLYRLISRWRNDKNPEEVVIENP